MSSQETTIVHAICHHGPKRHSAARDLTCKCPQMAGSSQAGWHHLLWCYRPFLRAHRPHHCKDFCATQKPSRTFQGEGSLVKGNLPFLCCLIPPSQPPPRLHALGIHSGLPEKPGNKQPAPPGRETVLGVKYFPYGHQGQWG